MPYIPKEDRPAISLTLPPPRVCNTLNVGELNYVLTRIIDQHMSRFAVSPSYGVINAVIGVLECVKLELYRRVAAPHEDKKCKENGDVYTVTEE